MTPETILRFIEPHIESQDNRKKLIELLSKEIKSTPKPMTREEQFQNEAFRSQEKKKVREEVIIANS